MRLSTIKTIVREELAKYGELPAWINPLLGTLNQFINSVGLALTGNLTYADNFACTEKVLILTHGVEQALNTGSNSRPTEVRIRDANGLVIDKFGWSRKADGSVGVTVYFDGGTSTTSIECRVLIYF